MKTIALYPGSFNPFHIGHLNILYKAERIFGKENVVVAMGVNPEKTTTESIETKCIELSSTLDRNVIHYSKFLHELVEDYEKQGYNVVIIRGLRNGADLDYEVNQMRFVDDFKKDMNVVYVTCDKEYEHVSSSAIRNLEKFRPGSGEQYLIKK